MCGLEWVLAWAPVGGFGPRWISLWPWPLLSDRSFTCSNKEQERTSRIDQYRRKFRSERSYYSDSGMRMYTKNTPGKTLKDTVSCTHRGSEQVVFFLVAHQHLQRLPDRRERERAAACGMNGFLTKPLELDDLLSGILRHLPVRAGPAASRPAARGNDRQARDADLPGIDELAWRQRLGNDEALFQSALQRFLTEWAALAAEGGSPLPSPDLLARQMHRHRPPHCHSSERTAAQPFSATG